jgi:hypothetical protein
VAARRSPARHVRANPLTLAIFGPLAGCCMAMRSACRAGGKVRIQANAEH